MRTKTGPAHSSSEVCFATAVRKASRRMTQLYDKLIALEASESDGRRRLVVMTAKGKAKYNAAAPLWQRGQDRVAAVFGKSAASSLRSTLLAIANEERLAQLAG